MGGASDVKVLHVRLEAPAERLPALASFYSRRLGLDAAPVRGRLSLAVGETAIEFVAGDGKPFYHFALLVPGDRFEEALAWVGARAELLPDPHSGEFVFDFENWDAHACYFHDPAGNVVELIAHRGVDESGAHGEFRPTELVGDPRAMAGVLARRLGFALWDGSVDEPGRLAFVGERARTLILAPPGRGWLPTGRPAEPHGVKALLAGRLEGEVELEERYRLRSAAREAAEAASRDID